MLTPMEIHNHEFKKGFRGYNENEVDDFLDQIVNDYERILRENDKLKGQMTMNEKEISHYKNIEKSLQDTVAAAQKTADEVIATAKKNAEEILSSAKKSAKELRENAVRDTQSIYDNTMKEAENIRENAKIDARKNLNQAAHKLRIVVDEYEKIVREKNSFLMKNRTALESELALTVQLLNSVTSTDELSNLRAILATIESENIISSTEISVKPEKKVELPTEKTVEIVKPEKKLVDKVAEIVEKAEPLEEIPNEDLDKTVTYKPIKK